MTISEVSKKYDIPADTLRYYEKAGLIPSVNRKESGIRDYTDSDCGWVEFIKCMRGAGLPVEVLAKYVRLFRKGNKTAEARKNILIEQRAQLAARIDELNVTLKRLDYKIKVYDEQFRPKEKQLLERD